MVSHYMYTVFHFMWFHILSVTNRQIEQAEDLLLWFYLKWAFESVDVVFKQVYLSSPPFDSSFWSSVQLCRYAWCLLRYPKRASHFLGWEWIKVILLWGMKGEVSPQCQNLCSTSDLYTMNWTSAIAMYYNKYAVHWDAIMRWMGRKLQSNPTPTVQMV